MKQYKIYTLSDPETKSIKYVGVTTSELNVRYAQHKHSASKRCYTICNKWFKSIVERGLLPTITQIDTATEENWEKKEKSYITLYKELGYKLTNQHPGGKGVIIDRKYSSIERSGRAKYRPIYQCDSEYNVIKLWESAKTASKVLGISQGSIYKCLEQTINTNPTAGGFRWVKKELFDNNTFLRKPRMDSKSYSYKINVVKKDLLDNIMIEYESLAVFAKAVNIPTHTIYRVFKKKDTYVFGDYKYQAIRQKDIVSPT